MILSYHINPNGIFVSNGKHQSEPPYIDFLLSQGQGKLNVCYHLDYNVCCLLVLLKFTEEQLIELYKHLGAKPCAELPGRLAFDPLE